MSATFLDDFISTQGEDPFFRNFASFFSDPLKKDGFVTVTMSSWPSAYRANQLRQTAYRALPRLPEDVTNMMQLSIPERDEIEDVLLHQYEDTISDHTGYKDLQKLGITIRNSLRETGQLHFYFEKHSLYVRFIGSVGREGHSIGKEESGSSDVLHRAVTSFSIYASRYKESNEAHLTSRQCCMKYSGDIKQHDLRRIVTMVSNAAQDLQSQEQAALTAFSH